MAELLIKVLRLPGGWIVMTDRQIGRMTDKDNALDLAHGMASAVRSTGGLARVEIEDGAKIKMADSDAARGSRDH